MKKLALIMFVLLLASTSCSTGGNAKTPTQPTNIPPQPTDTSILFQDDFSDTSGNWGKVWDSADGSSVGYAESSYRILVNKIQNISWGVTGSNNIDDDIIIDVDAVKGGGAADGFFGVICRYGMVNGQEQFYFLIFNSNGISSIAKLADNSVSTLATEQKSDQFPTINDGDSLHIRAECIGNTLSLYLNDIQLVTATDDTFTSGDAGLIAGTGDTSGTDILFDNFVVTKPSTSTPLPTKTAIPKSDAPTSLNREWLVTEKEISEFSNDIGIVGWTVEEEVPGDYRICRVFSGESWSINPNIAMDCIDRTTPGSTFEDIIASLYDDQVLYPTDIELKPVLSYEKDFALYTYQADNGQASYNAFLFSDGFLFRATVTVGTEGGDSPETIFERDGEVIETFLKNLLMTNLNKVKGNP